MKKLVIFTLVMSLMTSCVKNSSCNQFNIDSYELTTGINIPKVKTVDCNSDEQLRISAFQLDLENNTFKKRYQDLRGYINQYNFQARPGNTASILRGAHLMPSLPALDPSNSYVTEGQTKSGRYWKCVVYEPEGILITEMELVQ